MDLLLFCVQERNTYGLRSDPNQKYRNWFNRIPSSRFYPAFLLTQMFITFNSAQLIIILGYPIDRRFSGKIFNTHVTCDYSMSSLRILLVGKYRCRTAVLHNRCSINVRYNLAPSLLEWKLCFICSYKIA